MGFVRAKMRAGLVTLEIWFSELSSLPPHAFPNFGMSHIGEFDREDTVKR